jgi:hypothetical protein
MASTCKVTGSLATLPGMDAAAICDRFERNLAAGLGETQVPQDLAIALTLHPRGAIEARLSRGAQTYPVISVDTLDRALQPDDLDRLARAAVQVLGGDTSGQTARPAAHLKGK